MLVRKSAKPATRCRKCGCSRPTVVSEEHGPMHPRYCPYCGANYGSGYVVAGPIPDGSLFV